MANSLTVKIIEDGRRNAIVRIIGVADTSDITSIAAITLAQFLNNDPAPSTFNGLRFVEVDFAVTNGFSVLLDWNGNSPEAMLALADSGNLSGRRHGGYGPNRQASAYDGSINIRTRGFIPGNVYVFTVFLRLTKMYS